MLENITAYVPQFEPSASMSDWGPASRSAIKEVFPQVKLYCCWFHYTQRIWEKTQKLGLVHAFKYNTNVKSFIKQLMAIPFLLGPLINPTANFLQMPNSEHSEMENLENWNYFKNRWLTRISPEELSIHELRNEKWIFMPWRHANCCNQCSQRIEEFGQTCPVCRSVIESRFQIFTNNHTY